MLRLLCQVLIVNDKKVRSLPGTWFTTKGHKFVTNEQQDGDYQLAEMVVDKNGNAFYQLQHLYLLSDRPVLNGDWLMSSEKEVMRLVDKFPPGPAGAGKKIEASTNKHMNLPTVSQDFVFEYYDRGGIYRVTLDLEVPTTLLKDSNITNKSWLLDNSVKVKTRENGTAIITCYD